MNIKCRRVGYLKHFRRSVNWDAVALIWVAFLMGLFIGFGI